MGCVHILLVDDESALLALLKRHLERAGYSVVASLSAESAVEDTLQSPDWQPDLLITDVELPGMSGTALATELLSRFPRLLCLLCSGYPISLDALPASLRNRAAILQKPYLPAALERGVLDLLARQQAAG